MLIVTFISTLFPANKIDFNNAWIILRVMRTEESLELLNYAEKYGTQRYKFK